MKANRVIGRMLVLCLVLSIGILIAPRVAEAKPRVIARYYLGNHRIKYYSIVGSQYSNANAAMKKFAKSAYATNHDALNTYQEYLQDDPGLSPDTFYFKISPRVEYSAGGKLSILYTEEWWLGGPHPDTYYRSFNFYNGKNITLSGAFKSKATYSSANATAQEYWRLNWSQENLYEEPDPSETGIAKHQFYWTKGGMKVIYEAYSLGSYADGERRYPIPKSYLKY